MNSVRTTSITIERLDPCFGGEVLAKAQRRGTFGGISRLL